MHYLYKITNSINDRFYVGVTSQDINNYWGSGIAIKNALKKHGRKSFKKEVLAIYHDKKEAYDIERELITSEFIGSNPLCYNMCVGGKGGDLYDRSGENNPMYGTKGAFYGKKRPDHSKSMSGDKNPMKREDIRGKFNKPVDQYDLKGNYINTWDSIKEASLKTGTLPCSISRCCSGKLKTSNGFSWKFKQ